MKFQIAIARRAGLTDVDSAPKAILLAETTEGFVRIAATPALTSGLGDVLTAWRALAGLMSDEKPRSQKETEQLLSQFVLIEPDAEINQVVWNGGK